MKRKRSRAEWVKICDAFEGSGQTSAAFARRRGINRRTLNWWRSRLRREGALTDEPATFVEVEGMLPASGPPVVVRVGAITIEFQDAPPPVAWVIDLAARC